MRNYILLNWEYLFGDYQAENLDERAFLYYINNLVYISFTESGLNDAKYEVQFGPDEAGAPKTAYMFNPVKVDGQWYLCVKGANQAVDEWNR